MEQFLRKKWLHLKMKERTFLGGDLNLYMYSKLDKLDSISTRSDHQLYRKNGLKSNKKNEHMVL